MSRSRRRSGYQAGEMGRHFSGRFSVVPRTVLESQEYMDLPANAKNLLWEIVFQYNGKNNGLLTPAWAVLKNRGFSENTLNRAKKPLRESRFIFVTRAGRRGRSGLCELWALTWFLLDYDPEKMDILPADFARARWDLVRDLPKARKPEELKREKLVKEAMRAAAR